MRGLRHWIEATAFQTLTWVLKFLPRRWVLALGSFFGSLGFWIDARHRRVAIQNLHDAFGAEMTAQRARRIALDSYRHFGRITVDLLTLFERPAAELERLVIYRGLEHLERAYAAKPGVLIFSGHFGHWELMAFLQAHRGMPVGMVARPLDNPRLEAILARLRTASGNALLYKKNAVREMLRRIKSGGCAGLLIDQDQRELGVFVPFFGRPASTTPTLASLALRTGSTVIPTFTVPTEDGRYEIVYEPPIPYTRSDDLDADILRLTAACTERLEEWVRRYPSYWLWMHRRWKTQPKD